MCLDVWLVAGFVCLCSVCNYLVGFVMYAGQGSALAFCPHVVFADTIQNSPACFTIEQSHMENLQAIGPRATIWLFIFWLLSTMDICLQYMIIRRFDSSAMCHWGSSQLRGWPRVHAVSTS